MVLTFVISSVRTDEDVLGALDKRLPAFADLGICLPFYLSSEVMLHSFHYSPHMH